MKICTIGLGYVGLTLSAAIAKKGLDILGVDTNKTHIKNLNDFKSTIEEQDVVPILKNHLGRNFELSDNIDGLFDVFIISVGTPLNSEKQPMLDFVVSACKQIGFKIKKDNLIIVRSTVPVGTTREIIIPLIEETSGLKAGVDFDVAFAPERTIEGDAVNEIKNNPQIIGGLNDKSLHRSIEFFKNFVDITVPVSSVESAEIIKLMDNTYRDTRFAFSNEMALICEMLKLNAFECIEKANYKYPRNNIAMPSPGVGGPCLSKDPYILNYGVEKKGHSSDILKQSRFINEYMPIHLATKIIRKLKESKKDIPLTKIFVLGFAFKGQPETPDIRESSTLTLVKELMKQIPIIYGYDPIVPAKEIQKLGVKVVSVEDGFENADCIVFMNNHRKFESLDIEKLILMASNPCVFVDGWNSFTNLSSHANLIYTGVGIE